MPRTKVTPVDANGSATGEPDAALAGGSFSQTLSRGLRVLEVLAARGKPMSAAELSTALHMHRSVVYRLVRTLEEHRLLSTEPDGRHSLGLGILTLARGVRLDLRAAALPVLTGLAEQLGATAILGVVEGNEIVCVASAEPQNSFLHVRYREGLRHTISAGASGHAVLSAAAPRDDEGPEVRKARRRGYAVSLEELESGTAAVSAPVIVAGAPVRSCVTVLFPKGHLKDERAVGQLVIDAANKLAPSMY